MGFSGELLVVYACLHWWQKQLCFEGSTASPVCPACSEGLASLKFLFPFQGFVTSPLLPCLDGKKMIAEIWLQYLGELCGRFGSDWLAWEILQKFCSYFSLNQEKLFKGCGGLKHSSVEYSVCPTSAWRRWRKGTGVTGHSAKQGNLVCMQKYIWPFKFSGRPFLHCCRLWLWGSLLLL